MLIGDFCKKLSAARIEECFGFGGIAAMLPHRLPDQLPKDWPDSQEGDIIIDPENLDLIGFKFEKDEKDEEVEEEYETVYPIPRIQGLVLYGNRFFCKFGDGKVKLVLFREDGTAEVEGVSIPIKWDEEQRKYIIEQKE
jgi:hypothetical protein